MLNIIKFHTLMDEEIRDFKCDFSNHTLLSSQRMRQYH